MAEVKKPVAVAKKAAAPKTEAKKAEVKKAETKAAVAPAVKAEEKKAVAKKAPAKKEVAPKAETKVAEKKAPAKKAPAKKADTKATLFVQFQGRDYSEETLVKMAKDAYKAAGNKDALKTINVYANVDDQVAYYVANGNIEGKFDI